MIQQCGAERLEQGSIDGVALRVVFGVPLDTEGEGRCVGNTNGLDRTVFRNTFDDDPSTGLQNPLTM